MEKYILVLDSGLGGISLLNEMLKIAPGENYIYHGDTANMPYGEKDAKTVCDLVVKTIEDVIKLHKANEPKSIAIACNTATSAAISFIRERYSEIPVVGIEPALKPAVLAHPGGTVAVLATPLTLNEEKVSRIIFEYKSIADIIPIPCPGLAALIEKGNLEDPKIDTYLHKMLYSYNGKLDAVVLGCTHYPFIEDKIRALSGGADIFDGGPATAKELFRRTVPKADNGKGKIVFLSSSDNNDFERKAIHMLNLLSDNQKNLLINHTIKHSVKHTV